MIRVLVLTLPLLLGACAEVESSLDRTGRKAAKAVVTQSIIINFPQVPKQLVEPFTDCVIDNAEAVEVREFAKAAVVGVDDRTVEIVRSILSRPATQTCLRSNAPLTL